MFSFVILIVLVLAPLLELLLGNEFFVVIDVVLSLVSVLLSIALLDDAAATAAADVEADDDGWENDRCVVVVRCNVVAAVATGASAERRSFLRGGWSSEEAPVAAAFLMFLSILRFFP